MNGASLRLPKTLSLVETCCNTSGVTESIFLPIFTNGRPEADISTSLPGGPTACDASAELDRRSVTSIVAFGLLYRQLPRPKPTWHDAWAGAAVAAVLFCFGEFVLSAYLGRAAPVSPIGAAGSIFAVLIWVFYSAQIVYYGAEFAHACAVRRAASKSPSP